MPVVAAEIHFGTDGWRAVVGDDFTYENVRAVAQGVAAYLHGESRPVVVGHDARYCAELFAREVARVLAANGLQVLLLDRVTPTPAVSWTVVERAAAGGVVVTASHNPMEFNGLKYKPDFGGSASPEVVAQLEKNTVQALSKGVTAMGFDEAVSADIVRLVDPLPSYCTQLGRMVDLDRLRGAGLKVAHEAMYGAGAGLLARVLEGAARPSQSCTPNATRASGACIPNPSTATCPRRWR